MDSATAEVIKLTVGIIGFIVIVLVVLYFNSKDEQKTLDTLSKIDIENIRASSKTGDCPYCGAKHTE